MEVIDASRRGHSVVAARAIAAAAAMPTIAVTFRPRSGRPVPSSATQRSSLSRSREVCQRSSGSAARHRSTIRSSARGASGLNCESDGGGWASTDCMTSARVAPGKALRPVIIS